MNKIDLLKEYSVAILHMRKQLANNRLGVVFGAGASKSVGFPNWDELIRRIESEVLKDGSVKNLEIEAFRTQLLYQKFKEKCLEDEKKRKRFNQYGDIEIKKEWKKLVKEQLYYNKNEKYYSINNLKKRDKYIAKFVELINKTNVMTVSYNFDDTLERFLHDRDRSRNTRGYTTIWDSNVQIEKRNNIIYHPNGFLPYGNSRSPSEQLILSEGTFEDQLIDSYSGHYNALLNHYARATCLFVGHSLSDRTLKNMLRQTAKRCFGHYHYYIYYIKESEERCRECKKYKEYMESVRRANFETYNLFTLFLTNHEIAELVELIIMNDEDFRGVASKAEVHTSRYYFITGTVSSGKSTTVNHLKSLQTFEEWLDEMPENMEKDPGDLDNTKTEEIDRFIAEQVRKKNQMLDSKDNGGGSVNVIDRSPIDAFAFTIEHDKWNEKAKLLLNELNKGNTTLRKGTIIFLKADEHELYRRSIKRFKEYGEEALKTQQDLFEYLLEGVGSYSEDGSVNTVQVAKKTTEQVVKEVSEIIYFNEYKEVNFQSILDMIKEKGYEFTE